MKKSEKDAWVKALRSNEYRQGECYLRSLDEDGCFNFCCLGVAVSALTGKTPKLNQYSIKPGRFGLSDKLIEALALANDGCYQNFVMEKFKEAGFNTMPVQDKGGQASFESIANWIEENL
jgi:hypothetical protein